MKNSNLSLNPKYVQLAIAVLFIGLISLLSSCNPQAITGAADPSVSALRTNSVVTSTGETVVLDCDDDMPISSFPAVVLDAVAAAYPGFVIHEGKICASSGGTFYLFELYPTAVGGEDFNVVFDGSGAEYTLLDDNSSGSGTGSDDDDGDDDGDDGGDGGDGDGDGDDGGDGDGDEGGDGDGGDGDGEGDEG